MSTEPVPGRPEISSFTIKPSPWQTPEEVEKQKAVTLALADQRLAEGVEYMKLESWVRWWGKLIYEKTVGPPCWKYPKGRVHLYWSSRIITVAFGWRKTLYTLIYTPFRKKSKSND